MVACDNASLTGLICHCEWDVDVMRQCTVSCECCTSVWFAWHQPGGAGPPGIPPVPPAGHQGNSGGTQEPWPSINDAAMHLGVLPIPPAASETLFGYVSGGKAVVPRLQAPQLPHQQQRPAVVAGSSAAAAMLCPLLSHQQQLGVCVTMQRRWAVA